MTEPEAARRRVVAGIDGSDASYRALEYAVHAAQRYAAPLRILSCYTVPFYGEPGMFGAYAVESQVESIKREHEQILDVALARVGTRVGVDGVVVFSAAATALADEASDGALIVVGTTGRGGGLSDALGSVATAVCHKAHGPVVVVPQKSPEGNVSMKKIVVGIDGSPTSEDALRWAYDEARLAGAELVVLHGWSYPYSGWRAEPRDEMKVDALRQLEASIDALGVRRDHDGVTVHPRLVEDSPAKALIDEGADADLVVVGSRGRGGFKSLLLGSVSRAVVQHAPCPVAVIRHRDD